MTPLLITLLFAAAGLLVHLLTNGQYGFFRDEMYLLACGEHLSWGYVDHPPLIALIAKVSRAVFGDSLGGIRFLPAVAGAGKILLTGLITKELGGGRFAVALACLTVLVAPVFLAIDTLLSMNAFEPLFWMGCAYVVLLAIKRERPALLVWLGPLAGLGLMNKHSMLFFGVAFCAGVLFTAERRWLRSPWLWAAAAIVLLIFLPNLIWQHQHGWPTVEDLSNVRRMGKNVAVAPPEFILRQLVMLSPAAALVWLPGLWFLFFHAEGRRYRVLGWTFVVLFAVMMALQGKDYYTAPAYPLVLAAGGVFWEKRIALGTRLKWLKFALPAVVLGLGAVAAPMALPMLPPDRLVGYLETLGFRPPKTEVGHVGALPQNLGDMFGWPEMVEKVAQVYHSLPDEERGKAAILAGNYGEAGAIDLFGPRHGLPKAISGHQTYYFWGPRDFNGEVAILLQWSRERAERAFASVEDAAEVYHPYAMAEEHFRILVARGLKMPVRDFWPRIKHWN